MIAASRSGLTMLPCRVRSPSTEYTSTGADWRWIAPINDVIKPVRSACWVRIKNTSNAIAAISRPKRALARLTSRSARNIRVRDRRSGYRVHGERPGEGRADAGYPRNWVIRGENGSAPVDVITFAAYVKEARGRR